jgi:hypothetical protein
MNLKIRRTGGVMALPGKKSGGETISWLAPARVRAGRAGDMLIVLLSSAVFIMLGLAAMIVRFGPDVAPSTIAVAAPQPKAPAASASANVSEKAILRGSESPVGSNPARMEPVPAQTQAPALVASPTRLPANALAPAPVAREPAIVAAAPIAAQPTELAFARNVPPNAPPVAPSEPALPQREARLTAGPDRVSPARKAEIAKPEAAKPEPAKPEPVKPEPAKPETAKLAAASPEAGLRSGGPGATWAAYFDRFPDQKAAAAQINALQSKYNPHLDGRRLTYSRSGDGWRLRASGLTQEAAEQVCERVRKSGSACAIGAR